MTGPTQPATDPHWELARCLLRLVGPGRDGARARALRAVGERIGQVDVAYCGRPHEDVYAEVYACDTYPGGLRLYLDEVGRDRTGTLLWAQVEEWYRCLCPERLLTEAERAQLCALLESTAQADRLRPLARRLLGEAVDLPEGTGAEKRNELGLIVEAFEDAVVLDDEAHPLLAFVEAVAVREDHHTADRLRTWNRRLAARLGCPSWQLRKIRSEEAARAGRPIDPYVLLVEIVSRPAAPDDFHLRGWLLAPGLRDWTAVADLRLTSRPSLERAVADVHQAVLDRLGELSAGLRVEFLLPRALLWLEVDQFVVRPAGGAPRPLGADHTVVVRSRDRMRHRYWWLALQRRLDWMESHPYETFDHPAVRCLRTGDPMAPGELLAQLRYTIPPVCFVFLDPPQYSGDTADDPVYALLESGIPAIVAVRGKGSREDDRLELWNVLAGRLDQLPDRVRVMRGGVGPDGGPSAGLDLHRRVSLVWDSRVGLEGAEAVLGHPRTGGGDR